MNKEPIKNIQTPGKTPYILIFILILIWNCGIFILPICDITDNQIKLFYPFVKLIYSNVCHQIPGKTIFILKEPLAVCARCTGIYLGALSSSLLVLILYKHKLKLLKSVSNRILILSIIPGLSDTIMYRTGLYPYSKIFAFITGILLGSVCFLYILDAFENIISNRLNRTKF